MTHFHAVLLDETGCEFGAGHDCETREEAHNYFRDAYPEDTRAREAHTHDLIRRGADFDDEGRPFFPYGDEDDFDEEDEDETL